MEEEIINSLIQLGAAVVITYVVYLIIKEVLNFRNGGKNSKDNLSYQQTTDERLDALEQVTSNDFKHHFEAINEEFKEIKERVDKIDERLRKVEKNLAVIKFKIQ